MPLRAVPLSEEQANGLEHIGAYLLRQDATTAASQVLAIALAWRVAPEIRDHFACDIDESAGMAEVYEMDNYSRKVPCQ